MATTTATRRLPPCRCGATAWRNGDYRSSPYGTDSFHVCRKRGCGRIAVDLYREGCNAFLIPEKCRFTETDDAYINGPLMTTWRAHAANVAAWMRERTSGSLAKVNASLGLPLDTKGGTVPSDLYGVWSKGVDAEDAAARAALPEHIARSPVPPQLPAGMVAYVWQCATRAWERVSEAESWALPIPPDPWRVAHDKAFGELFAAVCGHYGEYCDVSPREIPNQYQKSEHQPWYVLDMQPGVTVTIGPRHSVISITVAAKDGGLRLERLAAVAERDGVTYDGNSREACIHAHGMAKAREYMLLAVGAALRVDTGAP